MRLSCGPGSQHEKSRLPSVSLGFCEPGSQAFRVAGRFPYARAYVCRCICVYVCVCVCVCAHASMHALASPHLASILSPPLPPSMPPSEGERERESCISPKAPEMWGPYGPGSLSRSLDLKEEEESSHFLALVFFDKKISRHSVIWKRVPAQGHIVNSPKSSIARRCYYPRGTQCSPCMCRGEHTVT